jgi:sarcosine oxidase, subunit gamma
MSDFELVHRPVLADVTPLLSDRIRLMPLPEGTVLHVFGNASLSGAVAEMAKARQLDMRPNGPGQWYLVGDDEAPTGAANDVPEGLSIVDVSHGRVRIGVEGDAVENVLAKATGVDLASFEIGHATTALFGHIAAHMTRKDAYRFELMPLRGFAESLWHDLTVMSAEFL